MIRVESFDFTPRFQRDFNKAPVDLQAATEEALELLTQDPIPSRLRPHRLKGYHPALWKIDVFSNHSWQIVFEMQGTKAVLKFLLTHKEADRL